MDAGDPAVIDAVTQGGAAENAGLHAGDEILAIAGQSVNDLTDVSRLLAPLSGQQILILVKRQQSEIELPVTVQQDLSEGRAVGRIGVRMKATIVMPDHMRALQKYSPVSALGHGVQQTWDTAALSFKMIWRMLVGKVSTKNLSGAISMVEFSGAAARQGALAFINWLALISVSIGVFNLLPIPMLDGGQVLYQLVELVKGSPISERVQQVSQQVGMALLLMLLSLTIYNDIMRHLG